ncbi:asparagine synthase-related protein [Streptomyces sp. NPDC001833]|uniref:asparagine synthetase B family protein n=1 Tax=Streptomyces sp. NPDC001833 TaxID=3154658 RepID=UPI003328D320
MARSRRPWARWDRVAGIAGWTDGQRDLTHADAEVTGMLTGLRVRAPHDGGTWSEPRAALVQRGDPVRRGPVAPATVREDGRTVAVAVCDGHLRNAAALWDALGAGRRPGPHPPSASEVIARAYLRWGTGLAERLEGLCSFAVWDTRSGDLVLGRDRFGVRPLSWIRTPGGVVFASDVAVVTAHPMVTPEADADALCALLTLMREDGRGALSGVNEVPPATVLRFTPDGAVRARAYWSLEAHEHVLDADATAKEADRLLRASVAADIEDDDTAVLLSGGLDSSVLAGLVATGTGRRPVTGTVSFARTTSRIPDRPFIEDVVRFWDCDHEDVVVDIDQVLDPATREEVLAAKDYPTPWGDKNVTPYLLSRSLAAHCAVGLSGEAADTMFGGLYGDLDGVPELTTFPWLEQARRFGVAHGIGTGLFHPDLLRVLDVDGYLERVFRTALDRVPVLPDDSPGRRTVRQIDHLTVTRLLEQTMLHTERLGAAAGVQMRFPFADHALYTFMYNVPVAMKFTGGRTKSILRDLARDLVPPSVLERRKSTFPALYDDRYKAFVTRRLRDLLDDPSAPVHAVTDLDAAARVADDPRLLDRGGWFGRADVEMLLQLDAWLRRHQVRLRI